MNNVGGGLANIRRKEEVLLRHCETVGRDPAEIERTTGIGTVVIRDDRARRSGSSARRSTRNGDAKRWTDQPVGTPEDVAETLAPFVELGYRHLDLGLPGAVRRGIDDAPRDRGPAAGSRALVS